MDEIQNEITWRLNIWSELFGEKKDRGISPSIIRELNIYGGAQGIYVDKNRTCAISPNGQGITVSVLHTSSDYPDELAEDGILYHYPKTKRPAIRDKNEIGATKNAGIDMCAYNLCAAATADS